MFASASVMNELFFKKHLFNKYLRVSCVDFYIWQLLHILNTAEILNIQNPIKSTGNIRNSSLIRVQYHPIQFHLVHVVCLFAKLFEFSLDSTLSQTALSQLVHTVHTDVINRRNKILNIQCVRKEYEIPLI